MTVHHAVITVTGDQRSHHQRGTIMNSTAAQLVVEARRGVDELDPATFAREADAGALVVDLRESEERVADGSIRGAVHIPRGMLEFRADPTSPYHDTRLDPARRILLVCASGGRSALAAETLRQLGYDDIGHLDGGLRAWTAAGFPVFGTQASPY